MTKRELLAVSAAIILAAVFLASYFLLFKQSSSIIKVFHAGSLSLALSDAEKAYEKLRPGVDIQREPSGSVKAVRKISDLGKWCDVVLTADYRVIEQYLIPKHADWLIIFCSNEVVLCYTDKSKYASEINSNNWYEILMRPGVKFGFSNPNLDPCGYRALTILYMASKYYGKDAIWEKLVVESIPNVEVKVNDSIHYVLFPSKPNYELGRLVLRDKSVDLVQLLEAGTLDYAFEYRNVAEEHGLKYVRLPPELSLVSRPYLNVRVVLHAGDPKRCRTVEISEIRYGLTIPKCCRNCKGAEEFVKWLLYGEGRKILEEHGFVIIPYEYKGPVPPSLRG